MNPSGLTPCEGNAGVGTCDDTMPLAVEKGDVGRAGAPDIVVGGSATSEDDGPSKLALRTDAGRGVPRRRPRVRLRGRTSSARAPAEILDGVAPGGPAENVTPLSARSRLKRPCMGPNTPRSRLHSPTSAPCSRSVATSRLRARPLSALLRLREAVYGPKHHEVAITLANLGNVHRQLGKLAAWRTALERVVVTFEESLGADHPYTIRARAQLASAED